MPALGILHLKDRMEIRNMRIIQLKVNQTDTQILSPPSSFNIWACARSALQSEITLDRREVYTSRLSKVLLSIEMYKNFDQHKFLYIYERTKKVSSIFYY